MARARRLAAAAIAIGAGVVAAVAGCSDTLMRETVLASTQTLIGVEVAQDARTNLYQGRAGYARQELFLVPTSKRVVNEGESGEAQNDPGSTPEVLGEIMADGVITPPGASEPARVGVYQRLAVGKLAVTSGAAVALLARDGVTARVVSEASAAPQRELEALARASQGVKFSVGQEPQAPWPAAADAWSKALGFAGYDDLIAKGTPADRAALAQRWRTALDAAKASAPTTAGDAPAGAKGGAQ